MSVGARIADTMNGFGGLGAIALLKLLNDSNVA
jgi:hypothetical protein